ncbi:MAG TPA: substrate-binding domain-containing protein, partial [Gaiellaceae bacterium]|nr:substrate-binding domain-containing protein [Gaiellaceae bacterium]
SAAGLHSHDLVAHADFGTGGGGEALAELLSRSEPPTGVICSSDMMAIGALHEAARRGIRVPDELSIVGFDGIDAAKWSVPELTTVEQPITQIADTAVQTLQTLIEQPERTLPNSYYPPILRERASTGKPRARSVVRA